MIVLALLGVNQNKITQVLKKVKGLGAKYVNKVHLVYGEYDIIVELKAYNPEISANLLKELRETEGVNVLKTYVVSDQITENNMENLVEAK